MDKLNHFFKQLYSSPSLLWKAGAGLIFFCFSIAIIFVPSLSLGFTDNSRYLFAGLLMFYALFRFYGFYVEYKSYHDE